MLTDVSAVLSLAIATVFVFAAWGKLRDLGAFRLELVDYGLLGPRGVAGAVWLVPALELAGAGTLVVPETRGVGAMVLIVLLATFSCAVGINLARGRTTIRCACFGANSQRLSIAMLVRNGLLALPLVGVIAGDTPSLTTPAIAAALLAWFFGLVMVEALQLFTNPEVRA